MRASANLISADPAPILLRLDQFLKFHALVATGGEAKLRVQGGEVRVNGAVERRRGLQLRPGDTVELARMKLVVPAET
ncbi:MULTISPECIES: RNA-binding S4 domain-containing protein [unclassified Synechococcus]|uniref:RNA-binding S4 domain-containing protein n=1 Tax=unclassified Synechococcus TaxID=2626047 RepID=UPI0037D9E1D4